MPRRLPAGRMDIPCPTRYTMQHETQRGLLLMTPSVPRSQEPRTAAILLPSLDYGGAARLALNLAAGAVGQRFTVQLWVLGMPAHLAPLAVAQGIELHWLGKAHGGGAVRLPRLVSLARRMRPDVLLCLGSGANVWGRLAGRLAGLPCVVGSLCRSGDGLRQVEPLLWPLAKRIIVPGEALRQELPAPARSRAVLLAPGVDCERFAPVRAQLRKDEPHVLCLGPLTRDRGLESLLRAFSRLLGSCPDARLMLVGDGPQRSRLVSLSRHLGVTERVQFLPARQDVAPLFHVARLVALPWLRAGLPVTALEAMASGVPVVAASGGCLEDVVLEGETGLLTAPGSSQPLAEAMAALLQDEELRQRMGQAARRHVCANYSLAAMQQRWLSLFSELAG